MLADIFSSLDPSIGSIDVSLSSNSIWIRIFISVICLTLNLWATPSPSISTIINLNLFILKQANETHNRHIDGIRLIITSLFLFLITANIISLFPYIFNLTRHITYTARIGFPVWLTYVYSSYRLRAKGSLGMLIPLDAPKLLRPFIALIATIRVLLRPIALCLRLTASILISHIFLTLLRSLRIWALFKRTLTSSMLTIIIARHIAFQRAVCFTQAYITCILLCLYANDHYKPVVWTTEWAPDIKTRTPWKLFLNDVSVFFTGHETIPLLKGRPYGELKPQAVSVFIPTPYHAIQIAPQADAPQCSFGLHHEDPSSLLCLDSLN